MLAFYLRSKLLSKRAEAMTETDSHFLRRQAEHCIALSRATFDLTLAGRLRAMAEEFRAKATHWENHGDDFHPQAYGSNGSHTGNPSRI